MSGKQKKGLLSSGALSIDYSSLQGPPGTHSKVTSASGKHLIFSHFLQQDFKHQIMLNIFLLF